MTNMSPTTILIEKIIKVVATSGFTMAILRFVTFAIREHLSNHKSSKSHKNNNIQRNIENFWFSLLQLIAIDRTKCCSSCKHCNKNVLQEEDAQSDKYYTSVYDSTDGTNMTNNKDNGDNVNVEEGDDELIQYKGSCHCQSVRFTVSRINRVN